SVGKIFDVFLGRGIREYEKTKSNADGLAKTICAMDAVDRGMIFVNLVDFDQQYAHRNAVEGYARALEDADRRLPPFANTVQDNDLAILTVDHGCDPTTPSKDHSREYVPLLVYGKKARAGVNLGTRKTLSDIGQTVAANFGTSISAGESFLGNLAAT